MNLVFIFQLLKLLLIFVLAIGVKVENEESEK